MISLHDARMQRFQAAGLYVVVTSSFCDGRDPLDVIRAVLDHGVTLIQLREKDLLLPDLLRLAEEARRLTDQAGALLIINDHLEAALAVDADGVHLGQDDQPVAQARLHAPDLVIGASTHSVQEALTAEAEGASYINIGPLFPTQTKTLAMPCLGLDGLREISRSVKIPFTVMGGIKQTHVPDLVEAGARTLAVVTAVTAAPDPGPAAAQLLDAIRGPLRMKHPVMLS